MPSRDRPPGARWKDDLERIDVAVYAAIAQTPTPTLDSAMARLSHAANFSRLSFASAAVLAAPRGPPAPRRPAAFEDDAPLRTGSPPWRPRPAASTPPSSHSATAGARTARP